MASLTRMIEGNARQFLIPTCNIGDEARICPYRMRHLHWPVQDQSKNLSILLEDGSATRADPVVENREKFL